MKIHALFSFIIGAALLTACKSEAVVPADASPTDEALRLYPDYTDLTIPSNIAPLNFKVMNDGEDYVAQIKGKGGEIVVAADADGKVQYDTLAWHNLLEASAGTPLTLTVYTRRDGKWLTHPATTYQVAEPIDRYLSYRLIEPSYELYRQLGIYQRDLTNFEQRPIYENNRSYDSINNHCINCHNYQGYDTRRMLFHVRARHGGTIFVQDGKARKLNMKSDSVLSSTVYPTWHPRRNWVVFSTNQTGQAFRISDNEKIEVMDYGSDLVFFDADACTLTNIFKTDDNLETFPCWTPDGRKIFYCSAYVPFFKDLPKAEREDKIMEMSDSLHYNLMSITFDERTRTFSEPVLEMDCEAIGLSASVPRVSPDGRFVLFTLGRNGQFHIWHKTSDLYVKDLQTGDIYPLKATNSPDVDSYHTWSSNGRWMVFSSRRDDGSYTRPYIAYFGADGQGRKAFILPQEDPDHHKKLLKSYNVPELTRTPVTISPEALKAVIYDDDNVQRVTYKP